MKTYESIWNTCKIIWKTYKLRIWATTNVGIDMITNVRLNMGLNMATNMGIDMTTNMGVATTWAQAKHRGDARCVTTRLLAGSRWGPSTSRCHHLVIEHMGEHAREGDYPHVPLPFDLMGPYRENLGSYAANQCFPQHHALLTGA